MRTSLNPASALGVDFKEEPSSSRPPDATIRANVEIMQAGMASFNQLMMAAAPHGGLQIVVSGNNPSVVRAPEKISQANVDSLSAVGKGTAEAVQKSEVQKKTETPPAVQEKSPVSQPYSETVSSYSTSSSLESDSKPAKPKVHKKKTENQNFSEAPEEKNFSDPNDPPDDMNAFQTPKD